MTFADPSSLDLKLVGGKGANLSRLTQEGLPVPPGFCISTEAYRTFLEVNDLGTRLRELAGQVDHEDPMALEKQAQEIRELVLNESMPAEIVGEITVGYAALGADIHVAVRSSGTAEDLAEASFAGQHDTYLDVQGSDDVIDAVKRCWASLWTARAMNYRSTHGFAHDAVLISVVVQKMVSSEVSGVMFTGNPLTTATDEIVINATWGLGEALVQGLVTPDEFVVQDPPGRIIERTLGAKEVRIVRDPHRGRGVVEEEVPEDERQRLSLDDDSVLELARIGRDVEAHYGGFPQDIEWARQDDTFYLVQSRPITGVNFSWDADVDLGCVQEDPIDALWTRAWSDSISTGVITPLTYSLRYPPISDRGYARMHSILGFDDLAAMRHHKYWKGESYFNVAPEREQIKRMVWPPLRPLLLDFIPPGEHEELLAADFDLPAFFDAIIKWHHDAPETTPYGFLPEAMKFRNRTDIDGLSFEELRALPDAEVVAYCRRMMELETRMVEETLPAFFITVRLSIAAINWICQNWYDGPDALAFPKLIGGTPTRSDTQHENSGQQDLVNEIRNSPALTAAFEAYTDGEFFAHLETFEEGRDFLSRYHVWRDAYGHRGHADRDLYYPRRFEDPAIDYRAFSVMLSAEPGALEEREAETNRQRVEAFNEVHASIKAKPGGELKAAMFTAVHQMVMDYALWRDNERHRPGDILMWSYKRGFSEIGRRLRERGLIDNDRDYHFLADHELYDLFEGRTKRTPLLDAKIAARARDCDLVLAKQSNHPMYLRRNRAVDLDHAVENDVEGVYRGLATSPGTVTGTARVVHDHSEMARIQRDDILVTHSTDPGWNPVFSVIKGAVVETGGMLSHTSCLAREYGFPAVCLPGAAKLIEDGATITVDGNTGTVTVVDADQP